MDTEAAVHFRVDPKTRRLLDRLREERHFNISSWARELLRKGLQEQFPEEFPEETPEALEPDPTSIETPEALEPDPTSIETPEALEPDPTSIETPEALEPDPTSIETPEALEPDPTSIETPEALEPDPTSIETPEALEPDPTSIEGWKPRRLSGGDWGAILEDERVAELPDNDHLLGSPIIVTSSKGDSWDTTIDEVVSRTESSIVIRTSGRPSS